MNYRNIQCSKCQKEFHCQRDQEQCWCYTWIIPTEVKDEMQSLYQDCLCVDCLKQVIDERSKDNNQG